MEYETKLKKWSYRIRIRDKNICFLCEEKKKKMEAHHIYPKHIYRKKALKMDNGITLCDECHKLVHTSAKSWRKYTPCFKLYMLRKRIKEFNKDVRYAVFSRNAKRATKRKTNNRRKSR